jgi:hypothetical protein
MQLKDPRHFGQWDFYIGGKADANNPEVEVEQIRIPMQGYFNTKRKLEEAVMIELQNLANQGATGYLEALNEEAASYGKTTTEFLSMLIEHQICLRAGSGKKDLCWSSGLGDKVHSVTEAIDNTVSKIPGLKKVWKTVVKVATPTASHPQRISSCRSCSGSRSFKASGSNRGRSGRF